MSGADKPIIVASMFGNTTDCVQRAKQRLEAAGHEVLVFHASGIGGRTMESLIESGLVAGVLDITTTEWADELVRGVLGAGPARVEAAFRRGVPAIVVPGCLDMVNFHAPETVPAEFAGRKFDPQLLADLPDGVDPCGENGEFHPCVVAGPMFSRRLAVTNGERVERDGYAYCDLVLD